jgi:hypothetical protein
MNNMTPGWKTSEAHITMVVVLGGFLFSRLGISDECRDEVLTKVAPYLSAGLASVGYAISRGLAKLRVPAAPISTTHPSDAR